METFWFVKKRKASRSDDFPLNKLHNKNPTHVNIVGHTSEFLFGIYWWTWKTTIHKKNCWSGSIKNVGILIFLTLFFKKKKRKKNTWRYHYFTPVYQKPGWYHLQFLRYRVWQTETGNHGSFLPFYLPKNQKIGDIILHKCTINDYHMMYSFWDMKCNRHVLSF